VFICECIYIYLFFCEVAYQTLTAVIKLYAFYLLLFKYFRRFLEKKSLMLTSLSKKNDIINY